MLPDSYSKGEKSYERLKIKIFVYDLLVRYLFYVLEFV